MAQQHILWVVIALTAGTLITRFLPFLLFPQGKSIPRYIEYLGQTLPYATMGMLVVYCIKGVSVLAYPYGLPELLAGALVVVLHVWKRNALLSIGAGTIVYMILVQAVF